MINGPMRDELIDFVKRELGLREDAVITRASFQITDQDDEISIIGSTAVEFQDKEMDSIEGDQLLISPTQTVRGRKKREPSGRVPKATSKERAVEGKGAKITEGQIKGWRIVLGIRERAGLLSAAQVAALKATKGIHAGTLTAEQKQQIKDIHDETTPRKF